MGAIEGVRVLGLAGLGARARVRVRDYKG